MIQKAYQKITLQGPSHVEIFSKSTQPKETKINSNFELHPDKANPITVDATSQPFIWTKESFRP
jgi:hypothetical protein